MSGPALGREPPAAQTAALPAPLGMRLADWALPVAGSGSVWSLPRDAREAKAVVVLFLGTGCPVNNLYLPVLADLHARYSPRGVVFVGVNSNSHDDRETVADHAKRFHLPFPVLKDDGAKVADRFAAARTPEAFVLDGDRTARYRGRIDDRYERGVTRSGVTKHELADAIDAILAGTAVAVPYTEPAGCPIARPPHRKSTGAAEVTYARDIAPLMQKHCQDCHRPGEAAPFSLLTYKDAVGWSAAIREVVDERRMPPWHADPAYSRFRNSRRLADADRNMILTWIAQGCIEGNPADLPPPKAFVQGWRISQPDAVFELPTPVQVPAQAPKGGIPYKFVVVTEPFAEEKWVQSVECRPGDASVVHHITAFLVAPGTDISRWNKQSDLEQLLTSYSDDGFLGGYSPGEDPVLLPDGQAKRIPKGARIALELHYTPNGKPATDCSKVGLVYARTPPVHVIRTGDAMQPFLFIPPGAANHKVVAAKTLSRPTVLVSLCPHMHLRAKSAQFHVVRPDGSRELMLNVPRYDFNWQTDYYLAEPVVLPKGTKIEFTVVYDNSAANPNNPDPKAFVTWGEQSWQEMMIGFFEYYYEDERAGGK